MVAERPKGEILLVTPEGVPLELELGTVVERAIALGFDLTLIGLGTIAIVVLMVLGGFSGAADQVWAIALLGLFLVRYGYFVFFETRWHGQSPGKRLLGLRVLSHDGAELGLDAIFARNVMRDVELFLPMVVAAAPEQLVGPTPPWLWAPALAWVGVLALLPVLTRERTRAGDLIAGTVVVRVPRAELQLDPSSRVSLTPVGFTPAQLAIYGEHELETLAELLREADRGRASLHALGVIARTVAAKVGFAGGEPDADPGRFLRAFYAAQRAALEERLLFGSRKASKLDR